MQNQARTKPGKVETLLNFKTGSQLREDWALLPLLFTRAAVYVAGLPRTVAWGIWLHSMHFKDAVYLLGEAGQVVVQLGGRCLDPSSDSPSTTSLRESFFARLPEWGH